MFRQLRLFEPGGDNGGARGAEKQPEGRINKGFAKVRSRRARRLQNTTVQDKRSGRRNLTQCTGGSHRNASDEADDVQGAETHFTFSELMTKEKLG